jgi:CBS domain-containing protein
MLLVAIRTHEEEEPGMRVGDAMTIRVVSVSPQATVQEAIARMLEEGIGAVAVCDGPLLVGIFTERDVLRVAGEGPLFSEIALDVVMTKRPITCAPEDDLIGAAQLMADKRIRHLPVCEGDFLIGMIGIRDVLGRLLEEAANQDDSARATARELLSRAPRA